MAASDWTELNDEELLKLPIRQLGLRIDQTELEAGVRRLYEELQAKGLENFRPVVYLGDEWFSPDGEVCIAVPFYLAHPRLKALEMKMMMEVEGGDPETFLKLLRHEAGHCFDHAYRFSRKTKWKDLFGSPRQTYEPEAYRPRPYSRSYVRNLERWYAQAHPDEDFAETFAVWLNPESEWEKRYQKWPGALAKLQFIDRIARNTGATPPKVDIITMPYSASKMGMTLETYYARKRRELAHELPDFYDEDLTQIFTRHLEEGEATVTAGSFLQKNRKRIIESVSYWTGERKYTVNNLVRRLVDRCALLKLRANEKNPQMHFEIAAFLATLVTNYMHTGKFQRRIEWRGRREAKRI